MIHQKINTKDELRRNKGRVDPLSKFGAWLWEGTMLPLDSFFGDNEPKYFVSHRHEDVHSAIVTIMGNSWLAVGNNFRRAISSCGKEHGFDLTEDLDLREGHVVWYGRGFTTGNDGDVGQAVLDHLGWPSPSAGDTSTIRVGCSGAGTENRGECA